MPLQVKIIVTVKQVPDPTGQLALESDFTIKRSGEVALDPADECGVEMGLRLVEAHGGEVVLVAMGPVQAREAIRRGLSMGAARAILISDPELAGADALQTAKLLGAAISTEQPDLVICGTESYDGSTGLVPPMLAELLHLPVLSQIKQLEVRLEGDDGVVTAHRQTADGWQVMRSSTPCLVSVTAGIAEPRYASLRGIMTARSKEVRELTRVELGVELGQTVETIERIESVEQQRVGVVVEDDGHSGVERICQALSEAGVLPGGER
ncbi:MAG: electron transfer flavoprotein subunit beta/FixA family protein [Candidatus Dormibacteraceae bacterium]